MEPLTWARRMPLKVAGVIGLVSAFMYLAVLIGQDDTTFVPQAMFWFAVMVGAGLMAWFADRVSGAGRALAASAGALFFILSLFSFGWFAFIYLAAVLLCVVGFFGAYTPKQESHIES